MGSMALIDVDNNTVSICIQLFSKGADTLSIVPYLTMRTPLANIGMLVWSLVNLAFLANSQEKIHIAIFLLTHALIMLKGPNFIT